VNQFEIGIPHVALQVETPKINLFSKGNYSHLFSCIDNEFVGNWPVQANRMCIAFEGALNVFKLVKRVKKELSDICFIFVWTCIHLQTVFKHFSIITDSLDDENEDLVWPLFCDWFSPLERGRCLLRTNSQFMLVLIARWHLKQLTKSSYFEIYEKRKERVNKPTLIARILVR
jgi:hypothetical protein